MRSCARNMPERVLIVVILLVIGASTDAPDTEIAEDGHVDMTARILSTHTFDTIKQLELGTGQYLEVVVTQSGTDIAIRLQGPEGRSLEFDSPTGVLGTERGSVVTDVAGHWSVALATRGGAPAGYLVEGVTVRPASDTDRRAALADQLTSRGNVLFSRGEHAEAVALHVRALALREASVGSNHPWTAASLRDIALQHAAQGDLDRAKDLLDRSIQIYEKNLGADHPDIAASLEALATVLFLKGDSNGGAALLSRIVDIKGRYLGEKHPDYQLSLGHLARLTRLPERKTAVNNVHDVFTNNCQMLSRGKLFSVAASTQLKQELIDNYTAAIAGECLKAGAPSDCQ